MAYAYGFGVSKLGLQVHNKGPFGLDQPGALYMGAPLQQLLQSVPQSGTDGGSWPML